MMTEVQYEEHNTCEKDIMIFDFLPQNLVGLIIKLYFCGEKI